MLNSKSFLSIDFGAGCLKIAEFEPSADGGLKLLRFGTRPLGLAGSQEAARENVVKKALGELLTEGGFVGRQASLSAPGFQVFSKFVKLPPVDSSKITQIIQYEAQQNVPFPLAETAWDYQILGNAPGGELEVLLVAVKSDVVEKLFSIGEGAGLRMDVVDASVAALCNAFRYNYADQDGCNLLIDVGAKTSNVILLEKNRLYARSVPVGANSITQEFAAESKLPFAEAEKIKIADGFVSLGGAYEEPDNPRVAAVSKVARNVLTRLHLQVNQTIQFYRTQQGGNAPVRVFLCGGGSILPYSTEFFTEKLNLPVDIFNPFRNVEIDASVDVEALERVAQCFGEVVGLGLRGVVQCPLELNLMPKSSRTRQEFNSKKPYLLAAAYALVVGVFAYGWFYSRVEAARREGLEKISSEVDRLRIPAEGLQREQAALENSIKQTEQLVNWLEDQTQWGDVFAELRRVLVAAEEAQRQKLGSAPGSVGVWIDTFLSAEVTQAVAATPTEETPSQPSYMMDPVLMKRYGLIPRGPTGEGGGESAGEGTVTKKSSPTNSTNEISSLSMTLRAVNLSRVKTGANNELVFEVQNQLKNSPIFDPNETRFDGDLKEEETTFSFPMKVKLKRPMKL